MVEIGFAGWENAKAIKINETTYPLYVQTVNNWGFDEDNPIALETFLSEIHFLVVSDGNCAVLSGSDFRDNFKEVPTTVKHALDIYSIWVDVWRRT